MNRENNYIRFAFIINAIQLVLSIGVYALRKFGLWEFTTIQIVGFALEVFIWLLASLVMFVSGSVTHKSTLWGYTILSLLPITLLTLASFGISFVESISAWSAFSFLGAAVMFWNKPVMILSAVINIENVYLFYAINIISLLFSALIGAALGRRINLKMHRSEDTTEILPQELMALTNAAAGVSEDTIDIDKEKIESEITEETATIVAQLSGDDDVAEEAVEAEQLVSAEDRAEAVRREAQAEIAAAQVKAEAEKAEAERRAQEEAAAKAAAEKAEAERRALEEAAAKAAAEKAEAERRAQEEAAAKAAEEKAEAERRAQEEAAAKAAAEKAEAERRALEEAAAKAAAEKAEAERRAQEEAVAKAAAEKAEAERRAQEEAEAAEVAANAGTGGTSITINPFDKEEADSAHGQDVIVIKDIRTGEEIKISVKKIVED